MSISSLPKGAALEEDPLGEKVVLHVQTSVYSLVALFKAAYWYTDSYYLFLDAPSTEPEIVRVELRHKDQACDEPLAVVGAEFLNRLVDEQVRQDTLSETNEIRSLLVKKAFFEGAAHLNPDLLDSNESHLPSAEADYAADHLEIGRETGA